MRACITAAHDRPMGRLTGQSAEAIRLVKLGGTALIDARALHRSPAAVRSPVDRMFGEGL